MSGDIATVWFPPAGSGDWVVSAGRLLDGNDLDTAVLISLFTDRLVTAAEVPDGSGDRRGWWGDTDGDLIGSRLWLLMRRKASAQTLLDAQAYIREALQWLIDDGVASKVDVEAEWARPSMLDARITIWSPGGVGTSLTYQWAWATLGQ